MNCVEVLFRYFMVKSVRGDGSKICYWQRLTQFSYPMHCDHPPKLVIAMAVIVGMTTARQNIVSCGFYHVGCVLSKLAE